MAKKTRNQDADMLMETSPQKKAKQSFPLFLRVAILLAFLWITGKGVIWILNRLGEAL